MPAPRPDMKNWGLVIAKTWEDPAFKRQLLQNPAQVLRQHGVTIPEGVDVRIVENTERIIHLPLPPKPSPQEMVDFILQPASAVMYPKCTTGSACSFC